LRRPVAGFYSAVDSGIGDQTSGLVGAGFFVIFNSNWVKMTSKPSIKQSR